MTVVAVELRSADRPPLELDLGVDDTTGRRARLGLQDWLDAIGAPAMDSMAIVHAAVELVANAVEHAGSPDGGPTRVHVIAELTADGDLVVDVQDHGQWGHPSDDIARGRGLAMAAGLVDHLEVTSTPDGTCARLRHRLSRPVRIERPASDPARSRPRPPMLVVTPAGPGSVRLTGAFGPDDADRVGAELLLASRGGTRPLEVDLAEVTELSADGLRMLGDLVAPSAGGLLVHSVVVVLAPEGSVARQALQRAGISADGV